MAKQAYTSINFGGAKRERVLQVAAVAEEYLAKGYRLTVRQLYYQLVARGLVENNMRSYQQVVIATVDARMCGVVDWDAVEDRTREFLDRSHWAGPASLVRACAEQYHEDLWRGQAARVFVVIEKEALAGVLQPVCHGLDVPLLPARGYASVSVLREFALERLQRAAEPRCVLLHLGDHDPSGLDMTRDLEARLRVFAPAVTLTVKRVALNMNQVEEVNPPANPAKQTDSRFEAYRRDFGDKSWELDALTPEYLEKLVTREVKHFIEPQAWQRAERRVRQGRAKLATVADELDNN